jgi:hypothetical protein
MVSHHITIPVPVSANSTGDMLMDLSWQRFVPDLRGSMKFALCQGFHAPVAKYLKPTKRRSPIRH